MGKGVLGNDQFQLAGEIFGPMDSHGLTKAVRQYQSLFHLFMASAEKNSRLPAITYRNEDKVWETMSYMDMQMEVADLAQSLVFLKMIEPQKSGTEQGRFAISAPNGREFFETEFAVNGARGTVVTIFPNYTPQEYSYILSDSRASGILAARSQVEMILERQKEYKELKFIVVKGQEGHERMSSGISIIGFENMIPYTMDETGKAIDSDSFWLGADEIYEERAAQSSLDDIANVIYSSGTTGAPKGVLLSNRNQISNVFQAQERLCIPVGLRHLNILPLHHSYAMMCDMLVPMACGSHVYFTDKEHLKDDLKGLPVDVMCAVPLLQEKILAGVKTKLEETGMGKKIKHLVFEKDHGLMHYLASAILRKKVVNPNFQYFINGGGGLPPEIAKELDKIGLTVVGGYGMTESSPVASVNYPDGRNMTTVGSSGPALVGIEMKFTNHGELLMRGPNIMTGYLGKPKETADTIDAEGFLHTGDLGHLDKDGNLYIDGRIKETIVLSTGKNINPSEIEKYAAGNIYINQMYVIGSLNGANSVEPKYRIDQKVLVALVAPNYASIPEEHRSSSDRLESFLMKQISSCLGSVADYERPKGVVVIEELMPGALMTQTGKVKRRHIVDKYGPQILEAYGRLEKSRQKNE